MAKQISEAAHSAKNKIKMTPGDRVLNLSFYLFITIFSVICLIPFVLVVSSSLTQEQALTANGYRLWPSEFSLDAYRLVMVSADIPQAYLVTIFITIAGTFLSMLFTCAVAYAMSVKNFKSRSVVALFIYFTMLFNGGLVATYLLITKTLALQNTIWVLLFPSICNAWNILLMRNFFNGIPDSLAESAKIDGANDIVILFKIIIPISLPGIATIGLFYALSYWNEWYKCLLYIDSNHSQYYTLQYLIQRILRQVNYAANQPAEAVGLNSISLPTYAYRMATIVVSTGPIILLYPFLQKYFVQGLTVGAVKG
ncbi:MAG TPA: carbohydrate ABC transporter permease [Candidatus Eisenbergiella merdavium]|uniref:Carbohydrate ABC transporter permease n=1 Tax=Candidatus Eisenbergiella merdavium TaxID=2838551 RepID=A0A9D2NGW5_9FIRM|nr:carbohydrate ABC transporter permease [Candidatus Eisenbergiella merdavium]